MSQVSHFKPYSNKAPIGLPQIGSVYPFLILNPFCTSFLLVGNLSCSNFKPATCIPRTFAGTLRVAIHS